MAQNITLLGASYADVPAVNLPKTGGGMARFTDVTDTTATAANVRVGNNFYKADGTKIQGSLVDGSATAPSSIAGTSATASVTAQLGYPRLLLSKTISVTPTVTAGYISTGTAGDSSVTLVSDVLAKTATTYTPTTTNQVISSDVYLAGDQTILGDANLLPENIKSGVTIFGVTGTHEGAPEDMVDWIIEQGTISGTNTWDYAIYHSGRAECWCDTASGERTTNTQWGNWYYSSSTVGGNAYPVDKNGNSLFGSKPYATLEYVATSNDAVCSIHRDGSATAAPTGYVYRPNNGTVAGFLRIFARGTVNSNWASV